VLGVERRPFRAGPGGEDRLELGLDAAVELAMAQVVAADAGAERVPELRLERAERDPAVGARVRPVARSPRRGTAPSAKWRAATIASQLWAPRVIDTSTSWPSPERSRSRSAARIANAAISAPPPMSAICPAGCTGGPPRSPVSPSSPARAR
jgi:hypothetical protein